MARVLVVIPTYNEAANIGPMIDALARVLPTANVLVVDDASPDGTADCVEAIAAAHTAGRVEVLRRSRKAGLGTAYVDGFRWGGERGHDVLVQMSRTGNRYARTMLQLPVHDVTAGYRAHRQSLLARLNLDTIRADGYGFQIELTYRARLAGAQVVEVPIQFGERTRGESKMSLRIVIEALWLVTRWGLRRRLADA